MSLLSPLVSALTYAGLALALASAASLLRPLRFLGIRSRRSALAALALGLPLDSSGAWWPWPEQHATGHTQLDGFVPNYQFVEFHEARVRGTPEAVYRAVRAVRANEIRTFRTLTWIRSPRFPWRERHESIMDPGQEPSLDVATRSGFVWLADEPGHESAVGAVVCCRPTRLSSADQFRGLTQPGFAKAGMNFRIEDLGAGECRVTTETRVFGTDPGARRRFGMYWAFIYPGSSLIRYGWLAAIKKRAEADDSVPEDTRRRGSRAYLRPRADRLRDVTSRMPGTLSSPALARVARRPRQAAAPRRQLDVPEHQGRCS